MIIPKYKVGPSIIPFAGKGLFADEVISKGDVIIAPDNVHTVWSEKKLREYAPDSVEVNPACAGLKIIFH